MFIVDENISPLTISFIKSLGYEIITIKEAGLSSLSDEHIINYAKTNKLALITFDKHFSNILQYPPGSHYGIIRIRIHPPLINVIHNSLKNYFSSFSIGNLKGSLIIIEEKGYRVRK